MKSFSVKIIRKRLKKISKVAFCIWITLALIFLYCIINLCFFVDYTLDDLQECEIKVDKVNLIDSHDTKGRRMKLEIVSQNTTYYVWYPQSKYGDFAQSVENDLLTGNVASIKVKIVKDQSIRDRLFNQKRVVDIRSSSTIYYDLIVEKNAIQNSRLSLWILSIFFLIVWLFYTIIISLIHGVIYFERK